MLIQGFHRLNSGNYTYFMFNRLSAINNPNIDLHMDPPNQTGHLTVHSKPDKLLSVP
ncbi:hypothetical protein SDC9_172022 [bioreactor metagenome]|uniref:Uncharacterized protein n=1 Tax=bioreactor metagenome TaxID=1076179 RepID=A0A645GCI5_9ZZZZ